MKKEEEEEGTIKQFLLIFQAITNTRKSKEEENY